MAETKLSAKTLRKSWIRWFFWHGSSQQAESMLGIAMGHALAPSLAELYANDKEERVAAFKRSITLFNTEQQVGAICPGIVIGMEEARASDKNVTPEIVQSVKVALIGPTSAIGDSMWVATIIPILLTICMAITENTGNLGWLGPVLYMICYPVGTAILSWKLWKLGYKTGVDGVYRFMSSGKLDIITKAMTVLGLVVVGGLTANFVNVTLPIEITPPGGEEAVMNLNVLVNNIFPGLLPLGLTLTIWQLYARKKWSPLAIMGLVLAIAIVLTAVGYLFGVYA